jgi:hypothetical protein
MVFGIRGPGVAVPAQLSPLPYRPLSVPGIPNYSVQVVQSIRAQSWATFAVKPLLVARLGRRILAQHYISRMTGPAASVANAADLMEDFARLRRFG